jgi:predicted GTPase
MNLARNRQILLVNGFREAWRFTGSPVNVKFRRKRETARR